MLIHTVSEVALLIEAGKVVAFPTETFYGLAVDPTNFQGVEELLEIKGRDLRAGVPLIADSVATFKKWVVTPENLQLREKVEKLISRFWPGPLTLVVKANQMAKDSFHPGIFGPDYTIAIRVSSSELARGLAQACKGLITATSANPKGLPAVKTVEEVRKYFSQMSILQGFAGTDKQELPSTILKVDSFPFKVLREGAVSGEVLNKWF